MNKIKKVCIKCKKSFWGFNKSLYCKNPCLPTYKDETYRKITREKSRFGIAREVIIKRDGEKCSKCGMGRDEHRKEFGRDITIDHINGRGRYSKNKDNKINNLRTLCLRCHGKKDVHRRTWRPVFKLI